MNMMNEMKPYCLLSLPVYLPVVCTCVDVKKKRLPQVIIIGAKKSGTSKGRMTSKLREMLLENFYLKFV